MKKVLSLVLSAMLVLGLTACSSSPSKPSVPPEPLSEHEINLMYSNPNDYSGRPVELTGEVFSDPEYDENAAYFQMFVDPENARLNTVVIYPNPSHKLKDGDYVRISGIVDKEFVGENMMGGEVHAPTIVVDKLDVLSYQEALSPTIHTASATTPTIDQYGYTVTIEKIELAENETRVYVKVENNGQSEFNLYEYRTRIVQDSSQIEQQSNYDADYPELQRDLRPGIISEGIICMGPLKDASFQLILDGSSDNWDEDIEEFIFDCTIDS